MLKLLKADEGLVVERILTCPYEERDSWEMNVMKVNGTLYFEEHQSDERLVERYVPPMFIYTPNYLWLKGLIPRNDMKPHHRRQTYYGYSFESYCTSTTPTRPPGWGGTVDTSEQWGSVVKTIRNAEDEARFEK
jgi:RAT1-interacting protein